MRKQTFIFYSIAALIILIGCADKTGVDKVGVVTEVGDITDPADNAADSDLSDTPNNEALLAAYSSEQVEYARVWLQLGPNQEVDELNVRHIAAGEPLNSIDDTSAAYPVDVIQLTGSRLVDGSVTYSSNGDGTIDVYPIPLRWDGVYPAGEDFYTELLAKKSLVSIDPGKAELILPLIEKLNVSPAIRP